MVLSGLWCFVAPRTAERHWPWAITTPSLRSISSFVVFTGVMLAWPLVDGRVGAVRFGLESVLVGLVLTGIGALRARHELIGPRSSVAVYVVALVLIIGAVGAAVGVTGRASRAPV